MSVRTPFDADPLGGELGQRQGKRHGRAVTTLIGDLDDDRASAPIVDDHPEVVVPEAGPMVARCVSPAEHLTRLARSRRIRSRVAAPDMVIRDWVAR